MASSYRFVCAILLSVLGIQIAAAQSDIRPRQLAPGVLTTIRDADFDDATLDETRQFTELLSVLNPRAWSPNFDPTTETLLEKATKVSFQRRIWSLEFSFKPLRVIRVGGEDIWYLVYAVRNNSEVRAPALTAEKSIEIRGAREPVRFIPSFVLQAHGLRQAYRDHIRPEVVALIAAKERVTRGQLHDSATISREPIPVSTPTSDKAVWGVATFDNVDPAADLISVFVEGLTNAYRWTPPPKGYDPNDPREQDLVQSKTLQLNFWRGGDAVDLHDNEVQYGIPLYPDEPARQQQVLDTYKLEKPLKHRWIYR